MREVVVRNAFFANFAVMEMIFNPDVFYVITVSMAVLAVIVFIAPHRIEAAYGMTYNPKWGSWFQTAPAG